MFIWDRPRDILPDEKDNPATKIRSALTRFHSVNLATKSIIPSNKEIPENPARLGAASVESICFLAAAVCSVAFHCKVGGRLGIHSMFIHPLLRIKCVLVPVASLPALIALGARGYSG